MTEKIKFAKLVDTINESPSGGFVGLTDYASKEGKVVTVLGRMGCSYGTARTLAIEALQKAIKEDDFEAIVVTGDCYKDGDVWNARKRSCPLKPYSLTVDVKQVKAYAKEILEAWENPKPRKDNKIQLSEKENGLVFNSVTGTINFSLMIVNETLNEEATKLLQEAKVQKVKAQAPDSNAKAVIRNRFEKKIKSYTIAEGNFAELTINGTTFASENITF